jgi:hypothetical protein
MAIHWHKFSFVGKLYLLDAFYKNVFQRNPIHVMLFELGRSVNEIHGKGIVAWLELIARRLIVMVKGKVPLFFLSCKGELS